MNTEDQRTRERVLFEIEAVFTHEGKDYVCICENVSMGGVLLETSEKFAKGDTGKVLIVLSNGAEHLEVKGSCRVVRVFILAWSLILWILKVLLFYIISCDIKKNKCGSILLPALCIE